MDKKTWAKWLAAAGVVGLVALMAAPPDEQPDRVRFAYMTKAQKDSVRITEMKNAVVGDEIVSLRTQSSRVTKVGRGRYNAMISAAPQNYLDTTDSVWKKIDLTVREVSALAKLDPLRKFDRFVDAGAYRATWKNKNRHNYTFYSGDYSVSYTALFDTVDVSAATEFTTTGVKQTYTFENAGSVQPLRWLMAGNTVKQKNADGSITFKDAGGKPLFMSPAPTAWDANRVDVLVTVVVSGDTLVYAVEPPEGVVWPISVDPTTEMFAVTYTNELYSQSTQWTAGANTGARDTTLAFSITSPQIGTYSGGGLYQAMRSRYLFNTATLPDAAVIDSVRFCLGVVSNDADGGGAFTIRVVAGTFGTGATTTDMFNDFTGWASTGAYSTTTLIVQSPLSSNYAVNDSIFGTLNAAGEALVDLTGYTKFMGLSSLDITGTTPTGNHYLQISAGQYLQVTYTAPPNAPSAFTNTSASNDTLYYSWTDNSGDESGFKIKRAGGDTATVASFAADVVAGAVGGLGVNTRHGLEVRAFSADGWSDPSDSVVAYTLANPPNAWNFTLIGASGTVDVGFGENGNPSTTQFAVRDSTNNAWVQTDGTTGASIAWATYATWNAVTITVPGTTGTVRYSVMARNGDNVNTAEVTSTLYVYKYQPATSFTVSNPTTTTLDVSWTLSGAGVDSLLIMNSPENTAVQYVSVAKTDTTVGGLSLNTLYPFFIRADSAGTKGDSNTDSLYTLAQAPTTWAFTEGSPLELTPSFSGGSNPAGTLYALRDSLRHVWLDASGNPIGTKTWRTEAQWEAITIGGLYYNQLYRIGVVGKNGDDVETAYLWGSVTTAALSTTINAINAGGLVSVPQSSAYTMFQPGTYGYAYGDSSDHDGARNYINGEGYSPTYIIAGQRYSGGVYTTYRGYTVFNTASIPDGVTITSAKVKFKLTNKNSITANDSLYLVQSSGFTGTPEQYYRRFTGWTDTGPYASIVKLAPGISCSGLTNGDSTSIYFTLNAAGLAAISKTGNTEFMLIAEKDRAGTSVSGDDYITLDPDYRYLQVYYDAYAYSRDVATGTVVDTLKVGQDSLAVNRDVIDRSFMLFPMPVGMTSVESATLNLYGYADSTTSGFNIYVVGANAYRPTLTAADFVNFNGRQALNTAHTSTILNDTWNTSSLTVGGWNTITLNSSGIDTLEAASGDSAALALMSANDFNAVTPTVMETVMFNSTNSNQPYLSISYALTKPSNLALTPISTTQITLTWTDNTSDETGFRVIDPTTYDYVDSVGAGVETITIGSLGINTVHSYSIQVKGGASDFEVSAADSMYTLAATPGLTTLTAPDNTSLKFVLNVSSNPAWTKIAVQDSVSGLYVHVGSAGAKSTLVSGVEWNTYSTWGGANGDTVAVEPGQHIRLRAAARNTAN